MSDATLYLKQLELGPMQNFIYLIGDPHTREAAVVDPGWEISKVCQAIEREGYRLTKVFITHTHFDHCMGLKELLKYVDVPVYVHKTEASQLGLESSTLKALSGGEQVSIGQLSVNCLHTPGHTPGSQCLLVDGNLLSGDTLFIGGCGRCDLPGGDAATMYESLSKKLKTLDDTTKLYPGHNYASVPTTDLGREKHANPYLGCATLSDFLRLIGG